MPNEENNTVYSGNISRNVMSGVMFSPTDGKGHWYAVKKGTKLCLNKETPSLPYLVEKQTTAKIDSAGRPQQAEQVLIGVGVGVESLSMEISPEESSVSRLCTRNLRLKISYKPRNRCPALNIQ